MYLTHGLEENNTSDEDVSIWTQVPLRDIGAKCIMNKHNKCRDRKCKCLCHQKKKTNRKKTIII